jgi:hypothetical protein
MRSEATCVGPVLGPMPFATVKCAWTPEPDAGGGAVRPHSRFVHSSIPLCARFAERFGVYLKWQRDRTPGGGRCGDFSGDCTQLRAAPACDGVTGSDEGRAAIPHCHFRSWGVCVRSPPWSERERGGA